MHNPRAPLALRLRDAAASFGSDSRTAVMEEAADRIAKLEAALRVLVDGYYSDDESVPTLEQWDAARELLKTK